MFEKLSLSLLSITRVFDKIINQSNLRIQYNDKTREFTLPSNRSYYVSWEADIDGSETVQSVDFCVVVNNAMISVSSSSQVTCQLTTMDFKNPKSY